jgi:hypothetical protein
MKQLTNPILTSQTVDKNRGDESRLASPSKVGFDMTSYQVRLFPSISSHKFLRLVRRVPVRLNKELNLK